MSHYGGQRNGAERPTTSSLERSKDGLLDQRVTDGFAGSQMELSCSRGLEMKTRACNVCASFRDAHGP